MSVYEGMFLLKSGDVGQGPDAHVDVVKGMLEKRNGVVKEIAKWDERRLAYDIGPHKRGVYVLAYFEAPADAIDRIKRDCKLSEEVIRVLILTAEKYVAKEQAPAEPAPEKPSQTEGAPAADTHGEPETLPGKAADGEELFADAAGGTEVRQPPENLEK